MYAREVEEAQTRLTELRSAGRENLVLAVLAFGVSLVATQLFPELAFPLFLGGVTVSVLGIRAVVRRWDLIDRLTGERDAYVIPQVLECATREATRERRRDMAATLRDLSPAQGHRTRPRSTPWPRSWSYSHTSLTTTRSTSTRRQRSHACVCSKR
jgi:hypothetical protein